MILHCEYLELRITMNTILYKVMINIIKSEFCDWFNMFLN